MTRAELLYNLALAKQKLAAQRKLYAQALNGRDYFLASIEEKTYRILKTRYEVCLAQVKEHLPDAMAA